MTEATHHDLITTQQTQVKASPHVARALLGAGVLIAILALGAYLRLLGLDWDNNQHLHPDERFLTQVETAIVPVASVADYFDTRNSTLNPNNRGHGLFVYGDLPIILVRYAGEWLGMTDYTNIYLVGRAISAGFDLMTVLLIFLVGRQLYDDRIGLLAAGIYATAAFPIQQSHFFTVDTFTNAFVVATFLFAVRALDRHRLTDVLFFGLFLGLAAASRVTVFPLALILALAVALRVLPQLPSLVDLEATWAHPPSRKLLKQAIIGLVVAAAVAIVTFRVAMPYAFVPPGTGASPPSALARLLEPIGLGPNPIWLDQMREVRFIVSGQWDAPPNHQWASRPILIFPWLNIVRFGLGWPLGLTAWLAFAWAIWEMVRGHHGWQRHALPLIWVGIFFAWQGVGWVKSMRYFLPTYPFLILLAAWALVTTWDRVSAFLKERGASPRHWSGVLSGVLLVGVPLLGAAWGFAFSRIYTQPHTRVAASDWIYEHVPSDVTFTIDTGEGERLYQLGLPNSWAPPSETFDEYLAPEARYTFLPPDAPLNTAFKSPHTGTVTGVTLNHVADPVNDTDFETLRIAVDGEHGDEQLVNVLVGDNFQTGPGEPRGRAYSLEIEPFEVTAGETYRFILETTRGPLVLSGSSLTTEGQWDDPVPLPKEGYHPWSAQLHGYQLELYWEDTADKQQRMQYVLDRSDYVVVTSNRFYDSLSRIPSRWPMTLDYYEALFSGELGFELAADFISEPRIGPIRFPDQAAEEAFHVYDHPRVMIFRKTSAYDSAITAEVLGRADLDAIERTRADQTKDRPLDLDPPRPIRNRGGSGGGAPPFDRQSPLNRAQGLAVAVWWGIMVLVGWVAFPVLFVALPGLPDRAYPLTKTFGLLFVAWLSWTLASVTLVSWTRLTLLASVAALVALSIALTLQRRHDLLAFIRANRTHLLAMEALTLGLFLYFLMVRLGNPDLWHPAYGGEKPMDFAYFNAVLRSETFPPFDPWFAGGTINYYYFGFVLVGAPVKLLGIFPALAYNLILPTLYALTGIGAFTAAFSLIARQTDHKALFRQSRAYVAGIASLLLAVLLGNLDQIRTLLFALAEVGGHDPGYGYKLLPPLGAMLDGLALQLAKGGNLPVGTGEWYWNATRLIPVPLNEGGIATEPGPITEFPYFTFLYADLHAHMIAMPLSLLALVWAIAQVRHARQVTDEPARGVRYWALTLFLAGLTIGGLRPTNTWDYPTYLLLGIAALAMAEIIRRGKFDLLALAGILWKGAVLVGLSIVLFLPYVRSYETAYNALDVWEGSKTPLWAYFDVHGLFLLILVTFLVWETRTWLRETTPESLVRARSWLRLVGALVLLVLGIAVYLALNDYPTTLIVLPLTLWAAILFFRTGLSPEKRIALGLMSTALVLSLFVEVYVLRGDIGRMNTVFKFYLQVWLLLSVAAGAAFAWLLPGLPAWRPRLRNAWSAAIAVLVFLAALYPITATGAKVADRWSPDAPTTLDGMAYMPYVTRHENGKAFSLAPDYEAIRWLQDNVEGNPVLLEANTVEYRWGNRYSIYTGLPAVVGWNWHQRQQRSLQPGEVIFSRVNDVATLYGTPDVEVTQDLLANYAVEYIVVGDLERAYFESSGLEKFERMAEDGLLQVVYDQQGTTIYRVIP